MRNSQLVEALKLNTDILKTFISSIPEDAMMNRRKDFWTIYEHLVHLVETQALLHHRIELFINEESPVMTPYNPEGAPESDEKKTAGELLEEFSNWRNKQVELIETCDDSTWDKMGEHPEYDSYSFETLVRHILLHDGYHMYRMEELWLLKDKFIKPLP
jgi:uncharacterized damage-inducible protein DinB